MNKGKLNLKNLINAYIEDHETAWATSTLKSERSRLRAVADKLDLGPEEVYRHLQDAGQKPYTIKTTFIRICDLEQWAKKGTKFKGFMEKHGNRFKHAYQKEQVGVSYAEALRRIEGMACEGSRAQARGLLTTGLRLSESYGVAGDAVTGKGGKARKVYGRISGTVPRSTLWKHLREVGLKPHTLRKLCATRLAELGATPADLCKIFGWSSIGTAYQYLQAKDDERIKELFERSNMETSSKGS